MGRILTFSIQKGGVGKSTTAGITGYLMAKEGYKVLVVDMDSQGNVTDLLTDMEPDDFEGKTVLEAIHENDAAPYIVPSTVENMDVLPADDFLATLPRFLYTTYKEKNPSGSPATVLKQLLDPLREKYDFILIDTPPSLGEQMTNAICASDYVVILAESSKWAFTAIPRFLEAMMFAKKNVNKNLQVAGILRTMTDARRADSKAFVKLIGQEYPEMIFEAVIKRKATTGRIAVEGFDDNKELGSAIKEYKKFYKELKSRMEVV